MPRSRFAFYAFVFLFGAWVDFYVRYWQMCYEKPISNLEVSSALLSIAHAIDWVSFPISSLRKLALVTDYGLLDWLVSPWLSAIIFLLFTILILFFFPIFTAFLYSWIITRAIRLFSHRKRIKI